MPSTDIFAVDIGATNIKLCEVQRDGELIGAVQLLATPYPCEPRRLVEVIAAEIATHECERVGVGFPGEFRDGRVVDPGNLSRSDGFTSAVDPRLHHAWINFDLEENLRRASGRHVRVVNDATMAALGCCRGTGRELVITLGTGFGIALVVGGQQVRIRDVGAAILVEGGTYDVLLGEHARAHDQLRWHELLRFAVAGFVDEFNASIVHLGGGNSGRVDLTWLADLHVPVIVNDNDVSLRGAARIFSS